MIKTIDFKPGDVVRVHQKIKEAETGKKSKEIKTRIQIFQGVVLKIKGSGDNKSFTVRKEVDRIGVERIYPVNSPNVEKVEVKGKIKQKVRRAKLNFLKRPLKK